MSPHTPSSITHHPAEKHTFSSKERDAETGLSYFGARYYSSELSIWLSVDPMSDKYPSLSPYVYCADNPVKLVDPNGEEMEDNIDKWRYNETTGKLDWISEQGGTTIQTVEFVKNTSSGTSVRTKAVSYSGQIGDMFEFSVISPSWDKKISGALSIAGGVLGFLSGVTIGTGLGVFTGGTATVVGAAMCFASAEAIGKGVETFVESSTQDRIIEQKVVRDICHSLGSFAVGQLSKPSDAEFKTNFAMLAGSIGWTAFQAKSALYPKLK